MAELMVTTGQPGAAGGGAVGGYGGPTEARPKEFLPPGYAGRVGKHQQQMALHQPSPLEISNMFNILSALGGLSLPDQRP